MPNEKELMKEKYKEHYKEIVNATSRNELRISSKILVSKFYEEIISNEPNIKKKIKLRDIKQKIISDKIFKYAQLRIKSENQGVLKDIQLIIKYQELRLEIINLIKELYNIQEIKPFTKNIELINLLEKWLLQLNLIAWQYISKKGVLQYDKRYYKLQHTQIWFLGLNMREKLDKLKGILPEDANMSKYSFHHEPPYRNHWHMIFTTGEFIQNHRKGSMKKE